MPSPFPGMDPYIEGQGWWGFSTQYIAQLQRELAPLLRPHFVAFIEEHIYLVAGPGGDSGRTRPDSVVAEQLRSPARSFPSPSGLTSLLEAPVTLRLPQLEVERQVYLEIRRRDAGKVGCIIELLSPINKARGPGLQEYLAKRAAFLASPAHLVGLDFLRGGSRVPMDDPLPPASFYVLVSRADRRPTCGVWPIQLPDRLPIIPIPLTGDIDPVPLDLQKVLDTVYDSASYAAMLDYEHGAEPPLHPEEAAWARSLLASYRGGNSAN